jgi:uncharacterized membrane protein
MKAMHIHLYKSLSYRILSITITFIVSYLATGSWSIAGSIASIDALIKFGVYFAHERAWSRFIQTLKKKRKSKKT